MARINVLPFGSTAVPDRYAHCLTFAPSTGSSIVPEAPFTGPGAPA